MPKVNIDWKEKFLEIKDIGPLNFTYDISFEKLGTEEEMTVWLVHLREKNWWTDTLEKDFILSCEEINDKQNGLV